VDATLMWVMLILMECCFMRAIDDSNQQQNQASKNIKTKTVGMPTKKHQAIDDAQTKQPRVTKQVHQSQE
jgi:hypothetical protein